MRLTVNGQETDVAAMEDLRPHWETIGQQQFAEVWLDAGVDGPALTMLVNGQRAWLMYLRSHEGNTGLSSRNPQYDGPRDTLMEFVLNNGQLDTHPAAWTLPLEQAMAACEYFVETRGGRSPHIIWHDDANDGD